MEPHQNPNPPTSQPQRLHPIDRFDVPNLMSIPIGSQTLLVDFHRSFMSAGIWNEANRDHIIGQINGHPDHETNHLAMVYTPPMPDAATVADAVVWENYGDGALEGPSMKHLLDTALSEGTLDGDGIMAMLRAAARMGGAL